MDQLPQLFRSAQSIAVLTGAGVSAESGVPTFRDALTGLWANFNPADLATPQAFDLDPKLVSQWYDRRRCDVGKCVPNAGHVALAQLQNQCISTGRKFTLIIQNVDRLHQLAGSTNVIELHGTLWLWRCTDCAQETEETGPAFAIYPPKCPCGDNKRPAVVWFGESLPKHAFAQAERAAASSNLLLTLGTSSVVYPAASLIDIALHSGAKVLEVNPEETPYSDRAHWSIRGKTGEVLPRLILDAFSNCG